MADEFKFPDEQDPKKGEVDVSVEEDGKDIEIEVVDDTPEEDRGRQPLKDPPPEVTDDELNQYSDSVKKRIQHFTKGYHDERRAKEAALREREEALRLAQQVMEENKRLQGSIGSGQKALLDQAKQVMAANMEKVKQKLKEAHENFDTDKIVAAQEELTALKIQADRLNNFKPQPLQKPQAAVQPAQAPDAQRQQPQQQPAPDPKVTAWQEANPWFGVDEDMTAVAMIAHRKLIQQGVDPTTDEYYERINARVREVFPNAFPSGRQGRKGGGVVAPASRSVAPRKITLTQTQVRLAKRLGITNEQYAREVLKQMRNQNG